MTSRMWTRVLIAIGVIATAGIALAVVVATRGDDSRGAEPRVAEPRFSDIRGRIDGSLARFEDLVGTQVNGYNLIGPARVRIAGRQILVPRGTPLYGANGGCGAITGDPRTTCFGQAGLRPGGHAARWILVFSTLGRRGDGTLHGQSPHWRGEIRSVSGDNIVFKDGSTVPGADAIVHCFDARVTFRASQISRVPNYQAWQWDATIDPVTGRAVQLNCAGEA